MFASTRHAHASRVLFHEMASRQPEESSGVCLGESLTGRDQIEPLPAPLDGFAINIAPTPRFSAPPANLLQREHCPPADLWPATG